MDESYDDLPDGVLVLDPTGTVLLANSAATRVLGTSREELKRWLREEGGYISIQGTRPQTVAYGLADSPVGLCGWLAEPTAELTVELRDPGLLKLHLEADPGPLAQAQLEAHRAKLAEYEAIAAAADPRDGPRGPWRTLQAGLRHEREWVAFWAEIAREAAG